MRFWKTQPLPKETTEDTRVFSNDKTGDEAACFLLSDSERISLVMIFIWLFFDWLF